jgi:hypothetical protein
METYTITESMRFRAILYFLGWQGGTISEASRVVGIPATTLLYAPLAREVGANGFSAIRTCDRAFRVGRLLPKHKGDFAFFSDAIRGFWATGPLDGLNDRWPEHPVKTGLMRCLNA